MDLHQAVHEARIISNANLRYYEDLSEIYGMTAKSMQLVGLLLNSAAVVALLAKSPPAAAMVAAVAAAVNSGVLLIFGPAMKAATTAGAAKHWRKRFTQWDTLWLEENENPQSVDLERYKVERARDDEFEQPDVRYYRGLSIRAQRDAIRALTPPEG